MLRFAPLNMLGWRLANYARWRSLNMLPAVAKYAPLRSANYARWRSLIGSANASLNNYLSAYLAPAGRTISAKRIISERSEHS